MTDQEEKDAAFLEYVVKHIVDRPEEVTVDRKVDEMGVLLTLDVAPDDMGNIIGRNGTTAKAIRTLLRAIGFKHNARVNLKINEPQRGAEGGGGSSVGTEQTETAEASTSENVNQDVDQAIEDLKT